MDAGSVEGLALLAELRSIGSPGWGRARERESERLGMVMASARMKALRGRVIILLVIAVVIFST